MNFKKNLNFLNGALHVLTLKQNSLNVFLGGEIHLDRFEFFFFKQRNTHMQCFICLITRNQGWWNFEIQIFTLFFFFWDDQLFSPCHKESSCHCPSANNFFRKEKLLGNMHKFDVLRHLWVQWTFRTPQYTLFYKPLHI